MSMIVDGHTGIEHSIPVAQVYEDVEQLWSATETGYTPTLGVAYGGMSGEIYWYGHTEVWADKRLSTFTPPRMLDAAGRRSVVAPLEEYNHIAIAATAAKLQDLGIEVHIGAHGQREGLAAHWEMWMLHQGGMEPLEVIRAATRDGASYIGMEEEIGSLAKGMKADLIVLEKNPLENIRHTKEIRWVSVDGRLYDANTMNALHGEKRAPFWWELKPGEIGRPGN